MNFTSTKITGLALALLLVQGSLVAEKGCLQRRAHSQVRCAKQGGAASELTLADRVGTAAHDATAAVTERAEAVRNTTVNTAHKVQEKTTQVATAAKEKVTDIAHKAKDTTVQTAHAAKEKATAVAHKVKDTAHGVADTVANKAHSAYDATKNAVVTAGDKVHEVGKEATGRVSNALAELKKPAERRAQIARERDEVEVIEVVTEVIVPKDTVAHVEVKPASIVQSHV